MQIAFGNVPPAAMGGGPQTSGASASFTHQPMDAWTSQRLDSPTGQRYLQAISQVTGLSQSDVSSQLQSGTSLHDILESHGATFAQVRDAVRAQGGQVQFGGHHHHARGAGDAAATAAISGLADTLGMTPSDLEQQLAGGASLNTLATSQGVSQDALQSSMQQAIQALLGYSSSGGSASGAVAPGLQVDTSA